MNIGSYELFCGQKVLLVHIVNSDSYVVLQRLGKSFQTRLMGVALHVKGLFLRTICVGKVMT